MQTVDAERPIILIWDNFGYLHDDRCEALAKIMRAGAVFIGIEIAGKSNTYNWNSEPAKNFEKITLHYHTSVDAVSFLKLVQSLMSKILGQGKADVFMCHYERPETFVVATLLRLFGRTVYVMNNSKFDDKKRNLWREALKACFFWPYSGALVAGARSADYMRFLGISPDRIAPGYNTLSIDRVRDWAGAPPAPEGAPLEQRHFTIISRYVEKKNLPFALLAYGFYLEEVEAPQELHLIGYGEQEDD